MNNQDREKLYHQLRVFILDTLVSQSGKQLTPDTIGQLTNELLERIIDLVTKEDDANS